MKQAFNFVESMNETVKAASNRVHSGKAKVAYADKHLDRMRTLLKKQEQRFADGQPSPWELAANDPAKPSLLPPGATAAQLAAWTAVSRVLLNLDETITKE